MSESFPTFLAALLLIQVEFDRRWGEFAVTQFSYYLVGDKELWGSWHGFLAWKSTRKRGVKNLSKGIPCNKCEQYQLGYCKYHQQHVVGTDTMPESECEYNYEVPLRN